MIVEGSGRAADELVHDLRRDREGLPDHAAVTDTVAPVIVDVDVTADDLEAVLGGILGGASAG